MNDVLIDAPVEITPDMIASLRITEVLRGTASNFGNTGELSWSPCLQFECNMLDFQILFFTDL